MSWKHVTLLGLITLGLLSNIIIFYLEFDNRFQLWCTIVASIAFLGFAFWICRIITKEQNTKLEQMKFEGKDRMKLAFEQKKEWEKILAEQRAARDMEQTIKDEVERQLNDKLNELKPSD